MTTFQKVIKYLAIALAIFLTVSIIGGILSAVGLFGGFFEDGKVMEDATVYEVSDTVTALEIEINAADFTIEKADSFSVESNLKNLKVKEQGGVLKLEETSLFGRTYNGAMLTLYVPEGTVFEKAEIKTGAGRVTVDALSADLLELELGAGEVNIDSLTAAKSADIDGGAGKITVAGGALCDLDLDMGVGQLDLTAALSGRSELDLGIGETNVTLLGDREDYTIDAEKGIGNLTVDGEPFTGRIGNGANRLEISGGIGAIKLNFTEK